jgi:hypothetical protein
MRKKKSLHSLLKETFKGKLLFDLSGFWMNAVQTSSTGYRMTCCYIYDTNACFSASRFHALSNDILLYDNRLKWHL